MKHEIIITGYLNCPHPVAQNKVLTAKTKLGAALKILYMFMFYDWIEIKQWTVEDASAEKSRNKNP